MIIQSLNVILSSLNHYKESDYELSASFLEIYNDQVIDLLNQPTESEKRSDSKWRSALSKLISIRQDTKGNISWVGVKEYAINSANDALR